MIDHSTVLVVAGAVVAYLAGRSHQGKVNRMSKIDTLSTETQAFVGSCSTDQLLKVVPLVGKVFPGASKELLDLTAALPPSLFQRFIAVVSLAIQAIDELKVIFPNLFGPPAPPAPTPTPTPTPTPAPPSS